MAVQAATMDGTPCPKSLAVFKIFRLPQAPQRACALPGHGRAGLPTWLSKTISCQMQAAAEALQSLWSSDGGAVQAVCSVCTRPGAARALAILGEAGEDGRSLTISARAMRLEEDQVEPFAARERTPQETLFVQCSEETSITKPHTRFWNLVADR